MRVESSLSSPSNPRFKAWRRAAAGETRKTGRTLAGGRRLTVELARDFPHLCRSWLIPEGWEAPLPGPATVARFSLAAPLFRSLDLLGTGHPLLEMEVSDLVSPLPDSLPDGMFLAIPLQDPANVGAVLRSAAGLGAGAAFLLPGCANPFHPKAIRAAAGNQFRLPLYAVEDLDSIRALGCRPLLLDSAGGPIGEYPFPKRFAFVLGVEGPGASSLEEMVGTGRAERVRIPMDRISLPAERIESYNAAVAAALAMYEWRRRRGPECRRRN
jgi:tRNA(Leu) C34 or U34 (ribose-2'-O)-methylase TrmL